MVFALMYILSIVGANYAFTVLPMIPLWGGAVLPMATFVVGLTFILRDYAQRAMGHSVLVPMGIASGVSYLLADPAVVIASVAAFVVAELVDWLVYSISKRPMHDRLLLSSAFSTPLDSIVFLGLLPFPGAFNPLAVTLMTATKMSVALVWWTAIKQLRKETTKA